MIYGSVCSGIEAASVAWGTLGWRAAFLSDIDPFARSVLAHHFPNTPLHGDFTTIAEGDYEPIDLLVGGTPCQSFSLAGLRGGLGDDRGNLALEYLRLADRLRPRWVVWENVPGVLSSGGGRDFGAILGGMAELGYGFAYRVLDAQFFGVPQRRRRVFVVGCTGGWRAAAAVLFERDGLRGHFAPRRKAGESVAALTKNGVGVSGVDDNQAQAGHIVSSTGNISHRPNAGGMGRQDYETETLIATPYRTSSNCGAWETGNRVDALTTGTDPASHLLVFGGARRLTPRECERLQGFPDDWTLIPHRGKPAKDGPRYKAIGNSMAVPVMRWIGERISAVDLEMQVNNGNGKGPAR